MIMIIQNDNVSLFSVGSFGWLVSLFRINIFWMRIRRLSGSLLPFLCRLFQLESFKLLLAGLFSFLASFTEACHPIPYRSDQTVCHLLVAALQFDAIWMQWFNAQSASDALRPSATAGFIPGSRRTPLNSCGFHRSFCSARFGRFAALDVSSFIPPRSFSRLLLLILKVLPFILRILRIVFTILCDPYQLVKLDRLSSRSFTVSPVRGPVVRPCTRLTRLIRLTIPKSGNLWKSNLKFEFQTKFKANALYTTAKRLVFGIFPNFEQIISRSFWGSIAIPDSMLIIPCRLMIED